MRLIDVANLRGQRRDIRSPQEIALKQSRGVPLVRSFVVLGIFSAGLTGTTAAQSPQAEESAGSRSLISALLSPMLPDTPSAEQSTGSGVKQKAPRPRNITSISMGVFPQLTTTRTGESGGYNWTTGISTAAGTLGTFRQTFNPWVGYTLNLGYSRTTANYQGQPTSGLSPYSPYAVRSNNYELTTAYVVHTSLKHRLQGFGELGGGVLIFAPLKNSLLINPSSVYAPPTTTVRAAGLVDAGVDYQFSEHFALRAEYRGLLYKQPDFGYQALEQFRFYTFTSEPTFSLVYNFRAKHKQ
jgi:opacity protein-like surface antigen